MSKRKLSMETYTILSATIKEVCPMCKEKNEAMHIFRSSDTSVTLRCKRCRFKFTVTWKSLADSFRELSKLYKEEKLESQYKFYSNALRMLSQANDVKGTHRYNKWASNRLSN